MFLIINKNKNHESHTNRGQEDVGFRYKKPIRNGKKTNTSSTKIQYSLDNGIVSREYPNPLTFSISLYSLLVTYYLLHPDQHLCSQLFLQRKQRYHKVRIQRRKTKIV